MYRQHKGQSVEQVIRREPDNSISDNFHFEKEHYSLRIFPAWEGETVVENWRYITVSCRPVNINNLVHCCFEIFFFFFACGGSSEKVDVHYKIL